jgi:hypothetical protein
MFRLGGMSTSKAVEENSTPYPPLSPTEAAESLGVPLSQRLKPDFSKAVPRRLVTKAEAEARDWPWYFTGSDVCRYAHNAARRTSNDGICADCERVKDGLKPIFGKSRTQKYYSEPRRKATDPSAPVVIAAPSAPAPQEITKREAELLAMSAELRDLDKAAAACGWSRGQIEARASANETFRNSLDDLLARLQIPRTLKAADTFAWTDTLRRSLIKNLVDSGLLHLARESVGASASDYFAELESNPTFAAMIEAARPLALETLKDRSLHAASTGNDRLLKILTDGSEAPDDISKMSHEQINGEITKLLQRFDKMGLLGSHERRHRVTGQIINLDDYEDVDSPNANLDLVSA